MTNMELSKVEFGKALAFAVKERNEIMKSLPEQLLDRIRNDVDSRLKISG
jgi:hypothetical protein